MESTSPGGTDFASSCTTVERRGADLASEKSRLEAEIDDLTERNLRETVRPELDRLSGLLDAARDEAEATAEAISRDERRMDEFRRLRDAAECESDEILRAIVEREGSIDKAPAKD